MKEAGMARTYKKKNIVIVYRQTDASPEAIQRRLDATFDLLFDELLKQNNASKPMDRTEHGI